MRKLSLILLLIFSYPSLSDSRLTIEKLDHFMGGGTVELAYGGSHIFYLSKMPGYPPQYYLEKYNIIDGAFKNLISITAEATSELITNEEGVVFFTALNKGSVQLKIVESESSNKTIELGCCSGKLFAPLIIQDTLFIQTQHGEIFFFDLNGEMLLRHDLSHRLNGNPILLEGYTVLTSSRYHFFKIDLKRPPNFYIPTPGIIGIDGPSSKDSGSQDSKGNDD